MKTHFFNIITVCLGFALVACASSNADMDEAKISEPNTLVQVIIKHKDSGKSFIISNHEDISLIEDQLDQKELILLKKQPIFQFDIELIYKNTSQTWHFAKPSYVMGQSKGSTQLYQLKDPTVITKHLK